MTTENVVMHTAQNTNETTSATPPSNPRQLDILDIHQQGRPIANRLQCAHTINEADALDELSLPYRSFTSESKMRTYTPKHHPQEMLSAK
jgi:hypothetical protein